MTIDAPALGSPEACIFNYSIISSDEEPEERIVLKLRLSEKTKTPVINVQRVNPSSELPKLQEVLVEMNHSPDDGVSNSSIICGKKNEKLGSPTKQERVSKAFKSEVSAVSEKDFHLKNLKVSIENMYMSSTEEVIEQQKVQHGGRKKENVVDINHTKSPRKLRSRSQSINCLEHDILLTPTKRAKVSDSNVDDKTPKSTKRRGQTREEDNCYTPTKKIIDALTPRSSKRVLAKKENSCTPSYVAEKSSKSDRFQTTPSKSNKCEVLGKRPVRTPLRFHDEDFIVQLTPRVNLDESFRRSVLKCKLNLDDIQRKTTPRRSARKSTFIEYFIDSDEEVTKSPTKSVTQSPSKRSRKLRSNSTSSIEDDKFVPTTPQRRRKESTQKTSPRCTPKTPKNRAKLIRDGVITPSMHSRASLVPNATTPLMKARSALHVSYVPATLPCREKEYCDIYNFLEGKLLDGCGGCMYISGVPGTGKTATVTSVISMLQQKRNIPKFKFVNINGMRLTEPRQSYVEIWKQLNNRTVPWEQAQSFLDDKFTKSSKKDRESIVMLIDELDILCTKRQDVVYNLLDWPTKAKNQLIVIAIANTMDLPERLLMSRVTSRLGLTRLTFQAYNFKQLQEIVTKRLSGTDSFNPDAIQLVARKVASVSGDARRALDICRRAAEMAEEEGKGELVNVTHINEALDAMITQPTVMAIKQCSRLEKLLLQAIVAEVERTGVEETTFVDVFKMLVSCCALDGFKMVSSTIAQRSIIQLNACRLILTDQKCNNIYQRIILNVSVHDVYFALRNNE